MKKSIIIICLLLIIITGCGNKIINTYKIKDGQETRTNEINYAIDQTTFKTSDIKIIDGNVSGKILNDDDYDRDINLTVNYFNKDNLIGSENFTVKDVYVGAINSFKFAIDKKYVNADKCTIVVDSVRKLIFTPQ